MIRAIHRLTAAAGFLLAAAALLWAMGGLSAWITRGQLMRDAGHELATLRDGLPLWQWTLRKPGDLVAGRAFGQADVASDANGLRFTSRDGSPFELGYRCLGRWIFTIGPCFVCACKAVPIPFWA